MAVKTSGQKKFYQDVSIASKIAMGIREPYEENVDMNNNNYISDKYKNYIALQQYVRKTLDGVSVGETFRPVEQENITEMNLSLYTENNKAYIDASELGLKESEKFSSILKGFCEQNKDKEITLNIDFALYLIGGFAVTSDISSETLVKESTSKIVGLNVFGNNKITTYLDLGLERIEINKGFTTKDGFEAFDLAKLGNFREELNLKLMQSGICRENESILFNSFAISELRLHAEKPDNNRLIDFNEKDVKAMLNFEVLKAKTKYSKASNIYASWLISKKAESALN